MANSTPAKRDHRDDAYWARVRRIAAAAPPLSEEQRAQLRVIFHQVPRSEAA